MGMHVRRQSPGDCDLLHDPPYAAHRQTPAALVDQKRGGSLLRLRQDALPLRQVSPQGRCRRSSERYKALLLSFAANQDGLVAHANVIDIDADQLRVSNAASIKQLQQQTVALGKCSHLRHLRVEDAIHLFDGRYPRQLFRQLRRGDELRRILLDHAFLRQPTIERSHRGQRPRHRRLAQSLFIKMRKESADRHVINALPLARTDVIGKIHQIAGIRLDGMRRSITLPQHAQELVRGFLDVGALVIGSFTHKIVFTTESQRMANFYEDSYSLDATRASKYLVSLGILLSLRLCASVVNQAFAFARG